LNAVQFISLAAPIYIAKMRH